MAKSITNHQIILNMKYHQQHDINHIFIDNVVNLYHSHFYILQDISNNHESKTKTPSHAIIPPNIYLVIKSNLKENYHKHLYKYNILKILLRIYIVREHLKLHFNL